MGDNSVLLPKLCARECCVNIQLMQPSVAQLYCQQFSMTRKVTVLSENGVLVRDRAKTSLAAVHRWRQSRLEGAPTGR